MIEGTYRLKRPLDVVLSALGLLVLSPAILVSLLAVRWTSSGGGIFSQVRVGRDGVPFNCHKLRTMYVGTASVPTHEVSTSRITPVGGFLRRTKLDELPQLWNVLKGEMSLVGPRPCLPEQTELMEARRRRRVVALRPGITGLAQSRGIDMADPARLAEIDAEYLLVVSLPADFKILIHTIISSEARQDRARN
ncbi:MAG: sugar transferase [Hyphomicrobiales bacterium]|nr:sugar transferase [Hyphomicrobiales bacterium]